MFHFANCAAIALMGGLVFILAPKITKAQMPTEAELGKKLAEKYCRTCHIISPAASGVVKADVPTFMSIANQPNQTEERIRGRIIQPHPPMPDLQLTVAEVAKLSTYIISLRDR